MEIQDPERFQQCAAASAASARTLATAGVLCIYAGAENTGSGVNLLLNSTVLAQIAQAYTNLANNPSQEDMYNIAITEPIQISLPVTEIEFEIVLEDLTKHLLYLYSALHNLHLSYARFQSAKVALNQNQQDQYSSIYQDARLFAVLQRQTIWRHLMLCLHLHTDVLMDASRVNLLWHKFKQGLPNQSIFSSHEIREVITDTWKEQAKAIASYNLMAFGIETPPAILQLLQQQETIARPVLLLDNQWHKNIAQLEQTYYETINTFYDQENT
ncbi:hypothetical protein [Dictyobacter arantiisoli]|uniref:Uncharacterized protein n=1 Tax=Dictyobacter arantiisoli TaxID=2014874 RepID=A0A5A5TEE2_9CHLR|nr:hypothetical protein [Dictyobacter arantiisoli]GCF09697.1 hypothetical protein KDI_32610 [Dictyobacter arantiisoli]